MVQVFNLTNVGNLHSREVLATFYGDRAYGRFGEGVSFNDVDGDGVDELIVTAPRRSLDYKEEFEGGRNKIIFSRDVMNDVMNGNEWFAG